MKSNSWKVAITEHFQLLDNPGELEIEVCFQYYYFFFLLSILLIQLSCSYNKNLHLEETKYSESLFSQINVITQNVQCSIKHGKKQENVNNC